MQADSISSAKNSAIKHAKKLLGSAKYRREESLAVAEGVHLAQSLLSAEFKPQRVICAESAMANSEVAALYGRLANPGVTMLVVKDSLFESLSDIHAGVGILAVFTPATPVQATEIMPHSLLLEAVQDPGNLGTMLRTAAAAGVKSVYLSPECASAWSPKALRAGMGAQFSVDIYEQAHLKKLIENSDTPVFATDLAADASIYETDLSSDIAWLFGNEGQGVSPELLAVCSTRVTIPQADSSVESLNVAAAAAVCLFEQCRQQSYQ